MQTKHETGQAWQAWVCAAPMPCLGVAIGLYLAKVSFAQHVAAIRAESADAVICGLPFIPALFTGLIGGSLGGVVAGAVIAQIVTRLIGRRKPS